MTMQDRIASHPLAYPVASRLMHWAVAVLVLAVWPLGAVISVVKDDAKTGFYFFHESLGFLILWLMLARMALPVSRISDLRPGDTIPLALGRSVALKLADTEIARGEVGACNGALALRLTSIAWNSPSKGPHNDR